MPEIVKGHLLALRYIFTIVTYLKRKVFQKEGTEKGIDICGACSSLFYFIQGTPKPKSLNLHDQGTTECLWEGALSL